MEKWKKACILNSLIVILEVIAITWMISGITESALAISGFRALRYFTVDSNILLGIFSLIAAIDERRVWKGRKEDVSALSLILKLMGTVGVTLTMLVTVFYLTPTTMQRYGLLGMYKGSNFLLHLVNPILAIFVFLRCERTSRIAFRHTWTGIIPMLIYAVYYVAEAVRHSDNGLIAPGYDWYGFFFNGVKSGVIMVPLLIFITYMISYVLWRLNRRKPAAMDASPYD